MSMIADAVEFIRKELRDRLAIDDKDVITQSVRKLSEEALNPGVYISLVSVQEETTLRNMPHVEGSSGQLSYREPPVYINLFLLFSFNCTQYATSLSYLSSTLELFQSKRWFSATTQSGANAIAFPKELEKLIIEMVNMSFEEQNNLWGGMGDGYLPSVVYKVRMVKLQVKQTTHAPVITHLDRTTVIR